VVLEAGSIRWARRIGGSDQDYRGSDLRALVHSGNDVIAQFTGQRGVFGPASPLP